MSPTFYVNNCERYAALPRGNRLRHSHTFDISANFGCFGVTVQALLMSPKGRNAYRDVLVILAVAVCLLKFVCYFVTYYVLGL